MSDRMVAELVSLGDDPTDLATLDELVPWERWYRRTKLEPEQRAAAKSRRSAAAKRGAETRRLNRERPTPVAADVLPPVDGFVPDWCPQMACICPVCDKTFWVKAYPETIRMLREQMAESQYVRVGTADPVYLRTCERHSLADVHRLYHPVHPQRQRRRRG